MTNHYHLVIETPDGNLSRGMCQLNGVYTQASKRRHNRTGHLFQGWFKGILVDKERYLLELTRHVVLNSVRAGIKHPVEYVCSSYRAMVGEATPPDWLATDGLLAQFGKWRANARRKYARFVVEGIASESIWAGLRQQIYLGDDKFEKRMQRKAAQQGDELSILRVQRRPPVQSIKTIAVKHPESNEAIVAAYSTGAYSYREIAEHFGLHLATVGRIIHSMLQYAN